MSKSALGQKSRGLGRDTIRLRYAIQRAFDKTDKPVTVRQMFYLLTTRNEVDKSDAGYRKAQRQLLLMRREGVIDYDWIADNTRWRRKPQTFNGLEECLEESRRFYRASVWRDLPVHVEVWCEKDALAGVLYRETGLYDVPLMVTRGYSSETFAYEAAQEMGSGRKTPIVYYVGDLDPSGWNASVDLEQKLRNFSDGKVIFKRLAVTPEQVAEWNLPTRPSKKSDTRHKAFEQEFGKDFPSVELDAIPPDRLRELVRNAIESHLPDGHLENIEIEEYEARRTLETVMEAISR